MRLFFGIGLPGDTALKVADWRDRQFPPLGRPVPVGNFHITLAFIGELPQRSLEGLCEDVERRLEQHPLRGGQMRLDQTGYWPRPGICWLGPSTCPTELKALATLLKNTAVAAGGRRERRRYQPHITLFRSCESPPPAPTVPADFRLAWDSFALYESRQGRQGVHYQAVAEWRLLV